MLMLVVTQPEKRGPDKISYICESNLFRLLKIGQALKKIAKIMMLLIGLAWLDRFRGLALHFGLGLFHDLDCGARRRGRFCGHAFLDFVDQYTQDRAGKPLGESERHAPAFVIQDRELDPVLAF